MAKPTLSPTGIRTDLVARLRGKTAAGDRVFDSRRVNYEAEELPAITVTTLGGTDDRWSIGTLLVKHTERLAIVGDVAGEDEAAKAGLRTRLTGLLSRLSPERRAAVVLHYVHGYSVQEISDAASVRRRHAEHIAVTKGVAFCQRRIAQAGIDLVDRDQNRFTGAPQKLRDVLIADRHPLGRIEHQHEDGGFLHGAQGLRAHGGQNPFGVGVEAPSVDHAKARAAP